MHGRQFELSDQDFQHIRQLVSEHTGIALSEGKRELVYGRLSRRLRALKLNSFSQYRQLLEQGDPVELEQFTNMITTNLTAFFRESHHFDYLQETLLPQLMRENSDQRKIRIWSAGCSTGEEPYSIAMTVKESIPYADGWDIKILASDLDSEVIAKAETGIYSEDRIKGLSQERLKRWFQRGTGPHQGKVRVNPELKKIISFKRLNLMEQWPMKGPFDIIFCRNVVIYFDKPTQTRLFARYADILKPDGHLFVGHSETLHKVTDRFTLLGKTIYRRSA